MACAQEPRTCDLSDGIVTDDATGTITFHLVEPDPEFLYKLTLSFAYPVPPSTPDERQNAEGVPGTGPYMLEAPKTRDGLALVRNPYFRIWSAAAQPEGYVDRIEWTFGVEFQAQVEAVLAGDADVAVDARYSDSPEDLFVRFPAQVHTDDFPANWMAVLNTDAPPFDDVNVRRAVNLALDRERIVQIVGGEGIARPTCQQLPPNFPGHEPYCPYTMNPGPDGEGLWTAPDIEEAQRLVDRSGTAGMRVVVEYASPRWDQLGPSLGEYMVDMLEDLGYRASVRAVPEEDFYSPTTEFQMGFQGWAPDYPAASSMFNQLLTCDAFFPPLSGFCDPRIDAMIDHATAVQADDPVASGALWAEIDREIVDQAPFLWLVNPIAFEFVSERVGNYQSNLQYGVLLNQLWVR